MEKITPKRVAQVLGSGRRLGKTVHVLRCDVDQADPNSTPRAAHRERQVREAVETLRRDGLAVCAHPSDGYYLAETESELSDCIAFLHKRAMTTLSQIARMKRVSLPVLFGQLAIQVKGNDHEEKVPRH